MAKNNNLTDFLTGVADAIRTKKGTTDLINPQDFESEILSIETGGSTEKQYTVRVYDYDGTILLETTGNDGDVINLPEVPTHEKLAFQEWVCSQSLNEDENSVTINGNDVAVGAVYASASGNHEFDIRLTKKTGLEVTLNVDGVKDWGDGSSGETNTHTYSEYGDYTISVSGSVDFSTALTNQTYSTPNYTLINVRLGIDYNVSGNDSFQSCRSLSTITIPRSYNSRNANYDFSFSYCYSLKHFTTEPGGIIKIRDTKFNDCYNISSIVIPNGVTSIGNNAFQYSYGLTSITIPGSVTSIGNNAFYNCIGLTSVTIPGSVISIGNSAFEYCYNISSIVIPNGVTSIGNNAFKSCYNISSIVIPNGVTSIGNNAFQTCYGLTSITIPGSVISIGTQTFFRCYSCLEYNFSNSTQVPTLSNVIAFSDINGIAKIIVPDSLYDTWITSTNWVDLADYIYKVSEVQEV